MTIDLLIHAIVRQTTILIAQLATAHGGRAPLAQVANQVFLDLVRELDRQGVSRKVSADMFGVGLRTYRRKIQRLGESATQRGRSLWEVVLEYVTKSGGGVSRQDILLRFLHDDEAQVRAVLRDLCESGLVVASGSGSDVSYRATSPEELSALPSTRGQEGTDELLIALMYREGPLTLEEIAGLAQLETRVIRDSIERLASAGRIQRVEDDDVPRYHARALVVPIGAEIGWEAAVFDHFKALVTTILARLGRRQSASAEQLQGGSTYTLAVWPGHPIAGEVEATLSRLRASLSELRERVNDFNRSNDVPDDHRRVVIYVGQNVIEEGNEHGS